MAGKDILKIIIPLVVIGIIILIARSVDDGKIEKERKTSVHGVVDSVFADQKEQEISVFARLRTNKGMMDFRIDKYLPASAITGELHRGDSISKDSGSLSMALIAPDGSSRDYKYIEE